MKGLVFDIQRFSIHDGPGIRTTVFLKGCPLHCFWCQNPEGIKPKPELQFYPDRCLGCGQCIAVCPQQAQMIEDGQHTYLRKKCHACGRCTEVCYTGALMLSGKMMTIEEIMEEILRDRIFYETSGGGVTLSGGEPLMQPDFSLKILKRCQSEGLHTAVETAADCHWEDLARLLTVTDLVMLDIKHIDPDKHREATGVSNKRILDNARRLAQTHQSFIVRVPIVPGVNDTLAVIRDITRFTRNFPNLQYLELLPFHHLGESKYHSLGLNCPGSHLKSPTKEKVAKLAAEARKSGIEVRGK